MTEEHDVDPDELDERAEEVRNGEFLTFEEHANKAE